MDGQLPSDDLLQNISKSIEVKKVAENEILMQIGEMCNNIYLVVNGALREYYIDKDGNEVTRFFCLEGSFCGEETFLSKEASAICIEAFIVGYQHLWFMLLQL